MADEFTELFAEWGLDAAGTPIPLSVRTNGGAGAVGKVRSDPKSRPGLPQMPQNRLVRSSTGDEVLSTTAVLAPLSMAGDFTLGSEVTLADGRVAAVLTVSTANVNGLFDYLVLNLE